jgi:hypothetical protein
MATAADHLSDIDTHLRDQGEAVGELLIGQDCQTAVITTTADRISKKLDASSAGTDRHMDRLFRASQHTHMLCASQRPQMDRIEKKVTSYQTDDAKRQKAFATDFAGFRKEHSDSSGNTLEHLGTLES